MAAFAVAVLGSRDAATNPAGANQQQLLEAL
jgi:hypothetical protein